MRKVLAVCAHGAVALLVLALTACGAGEDDSPARADPGGCQKDTECSAGRICENSVCVAATPPGGPTGCQKDTDCASGRICESGACVSGGTGGSAGNSPPAQPEAGAGGSGESGGTAKTPVCRTLTLVSATAVEKANAGFCLGMAYADDYSCQFEAEYNETWCFGNRTSYVVAWVGNAYGDVFDLSNDEFLASIEQASTGPFVITWVSGAYGECTVVGDVATLCVLEP